MNRPGEHGPTYNEPMGRTESSRPGTTTTTGSLKDKAAEVAGQVRDKAQEWASDVSSGAQQAWQTTRDKTQEWASDVAQTATEAWDGLGNFIRRYPVASICCALGIGFLVGSGIAAATRSRWD